MLELTYSGRLDALRRAAQALEDDPFNPDTRATLDAVRWASMSDSRREALRLLAAVAVDEWLDLRELPERRTIYAHWPVEGGALVARVEAAILAGLVSAMYGETISPADRAWTPPDDGDGAP